MSDTFADIVAKFKEHDVPLSQNDVWSIQGNRVLKHKALERLAAKLKIRFDHPHVVRSERDECVLIVMGHLGGYSDWSTGEAQPKNCKNAYPYAMAEKRAKDRVIIRLVGLEAYSEEEADDFRPAKDENHRTRAAETDEAARRIAAAKEAALAYVALAKTAMQNCTHIEEADAWWLEEAANRQKNGVTKDTPEGQELFRAYKEHRRGLPYADARAAG
jgi:hypothetical protein